MRPRPRELEQVVDGRPQHAPDRLGVERRLGEHGLAVPGLEELERRLLVAAHVRLEDRPLRLHGRLLHHVAHVQRVAVAGHHVRPAGVAGRPGPEDVAHRPDDVRLHLAQLRPLRERRVVERGQERAKVVERVVEPPCKLHSSLQCLCKQSKMHVSFCREAHMFGIRPRSPPPSSRATSRPRARPRCARAGRAAPPASARSRGASLPAPRARRRPARRRAARRRRPGSRSRRCATPARAPTTRRRARAAASPTTPRIASRRAWIDSASFLRGHRRSSMAGNPTASQRAGGG